MNKNKIITIILALIIILGIIITLTTGFNVEVNAKEHKEMQLNLGKEFNIEDIKEITDQVFEGKSVVIQKVEVFEEKVLIAAEEITEEQKSNFVSKINEKYQTEIKAESVIVDVVPKASLRDYVLPHIKEIALATLLVLLYVCVKYKKISLLKVFVQTALGIIIAQLLVFSVIAISRLQIGANIITVVLVTYAASLVCLTCMFENKMTEFKVEENKK